MRKGIPDSLRSTVWPILMFIQTPIPYKEAIANSSSELAQQIEMDVRRTYQNHSYFKENEEG